MIAEFEGLDEMITTPATLTRMVTSEDEVDDYDQAISLPVHSDVWVARFPASADDIATLGLQVSDETVYIRPATTVVGTEAITINGLRYEVVGPGKRLTDPSNGTDEFTKCHVRRTA